MTKNKGLIRWRINPCCHRHFVQCTNKLQFLSNHNRRIGSSLIVAAINDDSQDRKRRTQERREKRITLKMAIANARGEVARVARSITWGVLTLPIRIRGCILQVCKTDTMPGVFCAFYARFSVSFLCQSARDHNGGRDTLCNSENECEAFWIIITRPRPVLAVCFIHAYALHMYMRLPTHTRDPQGREIPGSLGIRARQWGVNVVMCATAFGNRAISRYTVIEV